MGSLKYWFWKLSFLVPIGVIFYAVASDGLRVLLPAAFAVKLYKLSLPLVANLEDDEWGSRLDVASAMTVFVVIGVCYVWESLIAIFIVNDSALGRCQPHIHPERKRLFLVLLGPALLFTDATVFYLGVTKQTAWGGGAGGVLPALVATALYVSLLVTAAFITAEAKYDKGDPT